MNTDLARALSVKYFFQYENYFPEGPCENLYDPHAIAASIQNEFLIYHSHFPEMYLNLWSSNLGCCDEPLMPLRKHV